MVRLAGGVLVICLLIASSPGCSPETATASIGPAQGSGPPVARRGDFQPKLLLTGELEAVSSERIVVPRTPVWQLPIRWMEEDGATVEEGQNVLELENTQFTADLEQKRLARSSAYNSVKRKEADVTGAILEMEFQFESARVALAKAALKAAIPEQIRSRRDYQEDQLAWARAQFEFDKAESDLDTAVRASEAEIDELNVELERTSEEIDTAEQAIGDLTLKAPRAGILVVAENRGEGRKYQVGDNVWVGLAVMRIPDLTAMKVVARLSDVDDGRIHLGARARCTLDTYPERVFPGEVVEIAPIAAEEDDQSLRRTFRVVIMLDESDPEMMRPGMSVKAELLPEPAADVVVAPRLALVVGEDSARALLADGSTADVRLGPCNAYECVIEEGLEEGVRLRVAQ